jgi:hypothetical protein
VNFAMVHFANRRSQLPIMVFTRSMVILDTQDARRNSDTLAFPFFLAGLPPRRASWIPIFQAAPPLKVRYKEKSDSAGSIASIVRPAVTSSTPATFFPCQGASASRFPRR